MNRSLGASRGKAEGKSDLEAAASRKAKNERQHSFQEKQKMQPTPGTIPGPRTQVLITWGLKASSRSQTINKHKTPGGTDGYDENKTNRWDRKTLRLF